MTGTPPRIATIGKYDPVGQCIYCGSTDSPLSDEHIIPEGLGGREILPQASCANCAKITCAFEGSVMRGSVWGLRQAMGMRGRKRRPSPIISALFSDGAGKVSSGEVHADDVALKGVIPVFLDPPGALRGAPRGSDFRLSFSLVADASKVAAGELPGTVVGVRPSSFGRLLAKIAHAKATAHFGVNGFTPFLQAAILGTDEDWPHFVGGANIEPLEPQPEVSHWIDVCALLPPLDHLILGRIRLFPEIGGPLYDVLIGQRLEAV